jgi:hypothetical protein
MVVERGKSHVKLKAELAGKTTKDVGDEGSDEDMKCSSFRLRRLREEGFK